MEDDEAEVRFYVGLELPFHARVPCLLLKPDSWDDYHFKTQFDLILHASSAAYPVPIGHVKILPRSFPATDDGDCRTSLAIPSEFSRLPSHEFCSLGQTSNYYTQLAQAAARLDVSASALAVLLADIGFVADTDRWWEDADGFEVSLLRTASAHIARRDAPALLAEETPEAHDRIAITVNRYTWGDIVPRAYEFRFDGKLRFPGRLNVVVGRNGSGKTTLLEGLASRLSAVRIRASSWEGYEPEFSRIVFVSNNAFDVGAALSRLRQPDDGGRVRTVGSDPRSRAKLDEALNQAEQATEAGWESVRASIFPTRASFLSIVPRANARLLTDLESLRGVEAWVAFTEQAFEGSAVSKLMLKEPRSAINEMSAGQKALAAIYAGLYRELDKQSLVLIDEPENYLHPSLIARFVREFNALLEERKAFALVATHSPIVVQETASRFVTIAERDGETVRLSRPSFETFGESIENIDNYLFETDFESSHWKRVLTDFVRNNLSDEEILTALQSTELPLLARAYLERERMRAERKEDDA